MEKQIRWHDHLIINSYWLGINISAGIIAPLLLPYLIVMFMPPEYKNTYFGTIRVIGLSVAMMTQPVFGMLSDRSTSRWGRRRPFIFSGAVLNCVFLVVLGASTLFVDAKSDAFFQGALGVSTAYFILVVGYVLLQVSSNVAHSATQGLIPDLVPENQRGRSSGVKSVFELLPIFLVLFIGPLVDKGLIWLVTAIMIAGFLVTMLISVIFIKEEPQTEKPKDKATEPILRVIALTAIFVGVSQSVVWLVRSSSGWLTQVGANITTKIVVIGVIGILGMAGSIFIGVFLGAFVGIGKEAPQQKSFIWWVVNRLLFLAAVTSVQGFAQYFLSDVIKVPNAATMTSILLAAVALFLMPSALGGGYLADRFGRKRLIFYSGIIAAVGTVVILFARSMPLAVVGGCIVGLGTGTFFATNWALGTDLAPSKHAGRYLGISNLAGAGAGIVGAGIGGPIADFFNAMQPGMGYIIIFSMYGLLFLLSSATLSFVKVEED